MELQNIKKKDILSNVRVDNNMFSLTDLWKLSGGKREQSPNFWINQDSTKNLLNTAMEFLNATQDCIIKTKRGKGGGSYAIRNLFLAYAKYLDSELHFIVNETFFERIEEENNPDKIVDRAINTYERKGMSAQWITKRLNAKGVRNEFTSTLKKHGVMGDGYRRCTNALYIGIYGKEASYVRKDKGLPEKANVRENMSLLELQAIAFAETLAMDDIEKNRKYGNEECAKTANQAARIVRASINEHRKNTQ